ncbi:hypothetical protein QAD02_003403 [Eretmocerus hayati]|uniref:Uncharacterized protein n=1 Tax=Eretmocerus hayati TaxID=131215 RepID=A0ACC2NLM0_9HYME|nr:hypothetical protein QAD02_003403 [Eretmocerus hayati]
MKQVHCFPIATGLKMVRTKAMARKWDGRGSREAARTKIVVKCPPRVKTPHRYEPRTLVERVIARYLRNPWGMKLGIKFQSSAVMALQQVSEEYLIEIFHVAAACAKHAERSRVKIEDFKLSLRLRSHRP